MRFSGVLILLTGLAFGGQDYGAKNVWNQVKNRLGTKSGIQKNADVPLKTDTPMQNIEGSQSFDVRVQCPSQKEGIKITFLPLPGNDYRLIVQEDLDQDGNYEYVYDTQSAGIRVSGVCYSGIVSCDPGGTWINCEYYYWDGGNSGYVSLVNTKNTSFLGGCFCSNSSCGVNSLVQEIVDYVSGGISQAVMNARQDLGVSRANFNLTSMSASLYVQDKTQCAYAGTRIWGEQNPTQVYSTQVPPDGFSYIASDPTIQTDPESPYYLVSRASEVQVNGQSIGYPDRFTCTIRNDVLIGNQKWTTWDGTDITPNCTGGVESISDLEMWCYIAPSPRSCGQRLTANPYGRYKYSISAGDDANCILKEGNTYIHNYRVGGGTGGYASCSYSGERFYSGSVYLEAFDAGGCYAPGRVAFAYYLRKSEDLNLSRSDNCSSRISQECVLKNERICDRNGDNCVQTIREGVSLGIAPQPSCYNLSSQIDNYIVCTDGSNITVTSSSGYNDKTFSGPDYWFYIEREYECPPQTVSIDLSRPSAVVENTSYSSSSGQISYTDFQCLEGNCTSTGNYTIDAGTPDLCPVAVCTVRLTNSDTSVFADKTNRSQTPGGASTTPLEVRSCTKETGGWTCPLESGEVLVEDCKCEQGLDGPGFSTSISVLQAVVNASKDLICSSVSP